MFISNLACKDACKAAEANWMPHFLEKEGLVVLKIIVWILVTLKDLNRKGWGERLKVCAELMQDGFFDDSHRIVWRCTALY